MSTFTVRLDAGDRARFTQRAADKLVGKVVPLVRRDDEDGPILSTHGMVRVTAARLIDDARAIELTVEQGGGATT
jgi:hypothetical protein